VIAPRYAPMEEWLIRSHGVLQTRSWNVEAVQSVVEKPHRVQRKRTRAEYKREWLKSPNRPRATCHPERPHRARGMCDRCYDKWLYANSANFRSQRLKSGSNWRKNHPADSRLADRKQKLLRKYGISLEEYDQLFSTQRGRCAICGRTDSILAVDHDHVTNRIRGLLCAPCNGALAWLERIEANQEGVGKAMSYLSEVQIVRTD